MLAAFLVETLNDLHGREHFGDHRADIGHPILAGARHLAQPPSEYGYGNNDCGDEQEQPHGEPRHQPEQIGRPADRHEKITKRNRYGCAHHLLDQRRIAGHPAGDFFRAVLFIETRRQSQQIFLHTQPNVGDNAFTQPAHEIEPHGRANGQNAHDHEKILKPARDVARVGTIGEAAIDHQLEACRNGERRGGGNAQSNQSQRDVAGIIGAGTINHPQGAKRAFARIVLGRPLTRKTSAALGFGIVLGSHGIQLGGRARKIHSAARAKAQFGNLCIAQEMPERQDSCLSPGTRQEKRPGQQGIRIALPRP